MPDDLVMCEEFSLPEKTLTEEEKAELKAAAEKWDATDILDISSEDWPDVPVKYIEGRMNGNISEDDTLRVKVVGKFMKNGRPALRMRFQF